MHDLDAIAVLEPVLRVRAARHDAAVDLDGHAFAPIARILKQIKDALFLVDFARLAVERDFHIRILAFMVGQQHRPVAGKTTPQ